MIIFKNLSKENPYKIFKHKYDQALAAGQQTIEAISISSYSKKINQVNSRFVNLKFVNQSEFIFFTNYDSPKSHEFQEHNQISILIYWNTINTQIRMKAIIKKTPIEFNKKYFAQRSFKKNALAISSKQSSKIESYAAIEKNFTHSLKNFNLEKCPDYWGGYSFKPYYFEFWEGHTSRVNKRTVYELKEKKWNKFILQP